MKHLRLPITAVLGLLIATYAVSAEPLVRHDFVGLRLKANVPQPQLDNYFDPRAGRAAYVVVRVTVAANGKATQAHAVRGFYTSAQALSAEKFAKALVWEPQIIDGKPVEASGEIPLRFWLPAVEFVPPAVVDSLKEAARHISASEWQAALERLNRMVANEITSNSSFMMVEALRSAVYDGKGDFREALWHARLALACRQEGSTAIPPAMVSQTLIRAMRLERRLGLYSDALKTWDQLQKFDSQNATPALTQEAAALRTLVTGDESIANWLELDQQGVEGMSLFRSGLAVDSVEAGSLDEATLHCKSADATAGHSNQYDLPLAQKAWEIPVTAKDCTLNLRGKPGTRIKIVQSGTATLL